MASIVTRTINIVNSTTSEAAAASTMVSYGSCELPLEFSGVAVWVTSVEEGLAVEGDDSRSEVLVRVVFRGEEVALVLSSLSLVIDPRVDVLLIEGEMEKRRVVVVT